MTCWRQSDTNNNKHCAEKAKIHRFANASTFEASQHMQSDEV
jgi:hypothetical protein